MKVSRKININVCETVKKAVGNRDDFHFYVDELTSENYMPTYAGSADEKYTFESMDQDFFNFLERKIQEDGIYIRLIHATSEQVSDCVTFKLECGNEEKIFKIKDTSDILVFDFADFGIKVLKDEITFGTTIDEGCAHTPYFAEFGSKNGNEQFLSLENPLNQFVIKLLCDMIVLDE